MYFDERIYDVCMYIFKMHISVMRVSIMPIFAMQRISPKNPYINDTCTYDISMIHVSLMKQVCMMHIYAP